MSRTGALHQTAQVLSDFDRRLINALQGDFPLSSTPFGPLFNIEQLGGTFSLCALHVPEERFEEVTELVNACPEVAHNYRRDHHWNMWFVLATETLEELEATFDDIVARSDCPGLNLPKEQEFYVGLRLTA